MRTLFEAFDDWTDDNGDVMVLLTCVLAFLAWVAGFLG